MRDTPVRDTPMRLAPLRDTCEIAYKRGGPYERHAYERQAYERRTYEMAACKGHAYEMAYARCTPLRDTPMRWPMGEARL